MASRRQQPSVAVDPSSTPVEIQALPLTTLKLCLDHYHLEQGGRKAVVVDRLFGHMQLLSGKNHSESDDSSNDESSDDGDNSDGAEEGPFTTAQQSALVKTVTNMLKQANKPQSSHNRKHSHHHTLSPPSDEPGHRQRSRHLSSSRHRKKPKRRHRSTSPDSSSSLSSTSWSSASSSHSSSHRKKSKRPHHKRRRPSVTISLPRDLTRKINRGEYIDLAKLLHKYYDKRVRS